MRNVTSPAKWRGSRTAIGLFTGAAVTIAMSLAGTSGAYAFNERLETLFTHFFDCKVLLLTNPAEHARLCGPSRVVTPFDSITSRGFVAGSPDGAPVVDEGDGDTCEGDWCECQERDWYREDA